MSNRDASYITFKKHHINEKFANDVVEIIRPGIEYIWDNGVPDREGYPKKKHRGN